MYNGEITAQDAIEQLDLFESGGIEVYIDGGWRVDALLGPPNPPTPGSRHHPPLPRSVLLRRLLIVAGFVQIPTDDAWEHNFVVQDDRLRRIDVHSYMLDSDGSNIGGVAYAGHHLTGSGTIGGRHARCIPVDTMIEFHLGYAPDENDFADVCALCEAFDRPAPVDYQHFVR